MGWLASTSLLATQGGVMCGMNAAQKAAATPTRTSARKLEASFFAYRLRRGAPEGTLQGEVQARSRGGCTREGA